MRASWLGDGGQPVPLAQANARAAICFTCPRHGTNRVKWEALSSTVADQLRLKLGLDLHVDRESELHVCGVCDCYLPLKVWTPLEHILTSSDTRGLPRECWIITEFAAADREKP